MSEDILAKAVADFESRFTIVDDHYQHTDSSRTHEGFRFHRLVPGSSEVTEPVAFGDHADCVAAWVKDANEYAGRVPNTDYLAWRVRPHFVQLEAGGFTIVSILCVPPSGSLSDDSKARIAAQAADKEADFGAATAKTVKPVRGKKGKPSEPVEPVEPEAPPPSEPSPL